MSDTNIGLGGGPYADDGSSHKIVTLPAWGDNVQASRYEVPSDYSGGWLKNINFEVAGSGATTTFRACLWEDDRGEAGGNLKYVSAPMTQASAPSVSWRRWNLTTAESKAVRIEAGKSYWCGFWSYPNLARKFRVNTQNPNPRGSKRSESVPVSFTGFGFEPSTLGTDFFYQQNAKPSTGVVTSPRGGPVISPASEGPVVATTQPTFWGTTPHNNGDAAYDYSAAVHLVVWRTDTNVTLLDKTYETSQLERDNWFFARASEVVLPSNVPLKVKFRHQDSWGVWSDFSAEQPFSCAPGPQAPTLSAPSGRTNLITGNIYSGTYTHETGVASNAIQIRVYNEQGTQVIFDSGTIAKTVTHNAPWTQNQFHAALTYGARYQWEARFRAFSATAGTDVWGPYSTKMTFKVNSTPFPPTDMTPGQNRDTGEQTLRATVTDPDGDTITSAEVELFDITANAAVTGLGTPSVTGSVMTLSVVSKLTSAVYNHQFRWRARAFDGFVFGEWSAWEVFTFRASPQGVYLLPLLGDVRNDVKVPSAEYEDLSSTYWTETGRQRGANFLSANQSSAETDLTGIVALYDTPVTRSSTEHFDGAWSVRFDSTGLGTDGHPRHGFYTNPATSSLIQLGSYGIVSASVKAPAGTTLTIAGRVLDEDDNLITETAGQQTIIATGSEQRIQSLAFRYEFPGEEPGTTDLADFKAGVQVATPSGSSAGAVVYADKLQVEQVFNEDDVATDWEIGSLGLSSYIERVADSDAAFGSASWEAVNDGNRPTHSYTSDFIDVDATKPRLFYGHVKKMTPQFTAFTTFAVECYNASGTLLGTIYPSSMAPSQNVDALPYWRAIGGVVWQVGSANSPAYPSGTTKVKERWWPNTGTEPVTMRFDGAFSSSFPSGATLTASDIADAANWYGYFDGGTEGYGGSITDAGYSWTGTLGASASSGLSIARGTPLFIYITYSHPTGLAKNADKLTIYRQDAKGDWVSVHAGAWEVSTRTKIPIPANILSSENRYKMTVELRDSSMIVAQMPELVFDVRYEGPPELNILIARADPTTAQVHLSFDGTSLGVTAFGGIEIAVGPDKTVVDLLTDPNKQSYVYPYPVSGEATDYWVRQVENRGADQVESRWDHAVVDISYEQWWLKDIEDPSGIALPVRVMAQDAPEIDNAPSNTAYRPWLARNRVHIIGPGRQESGSLVVRLKDSDQQLQDRLDLIQEIYDRRKVMCLLMTRPNQKRFVQVLDIKQTSAQVPFYAIYELSFSEANFSESYYEREKKS